MIIEIKVPPAGESVTEAEIAFWHKEDGDIVELDEPLVELETEKASQEVCAEAAGKLTISAEAGSTVKVGAVIATLDTDAAPAESDAGDDESDDEPEAEVSEPAEPAEPAVAVVAKQEVPQPKAEAIKAESSDKAPVGGSEPEEAVNVEPEPEPSSDHSLFSGRAKKVPSPAARRLMVLNGVSSQDVHGTGRDGRITKSDVLRYLKHREKQLRIPSTVSLKAPELKELREEAAKAAEAASEKGVSKKPEPDAESGVRKERMSMMRRTIANRLVEAQQTAAILSTFNEIDMHNVMELRKSYKESFMKKYGVNLGFMSFFAKAVAVGLKEFPVINAQIQGDEIVYHEYVNLGVAVSTPKGLMVPVVKNIQDLGFHEIEQEISALGAKGREGKINLDDLSGGTFTITNGGTFGSMLSTPILNRPQSGILGMHNIVQRPWVVDGEIQVRPIMYVALSYDHRLIDGAQAVRFLVTVKECIEDPSRIMLEI